MSTKMYLATAHGVCVIEDLHGKWQSKGRLERELVQCIAVDSRVKNVIYCGTFGAGVFRSDDAGDRWRPCNALTNQKVMSLAIGESEDTSGPAVVYAGTEPSAIHRSSDGGEVWDALPSFLNLPSAGEWSFPPRPTTHHVRYMLPDPCIAGRLHVAIEAGALLRSEDGGETWRGRVPGSPKDTHTLAAHKGAPGRLYSAAGDGYFESIDDGDSWRRLIDGLEHRYCWSIALNTSDPNTMLLTASKSAREAHSKDSADSFIYRRSAGEPWRPATRGLPGSKGRRIGVVAASEIEPGVFYLSSEGEIYRSVNNGLDWRKLTIECTALNS